MSGISLSTGPVVPVDVTKDLLGVHQVGEEAYHMFKKKCLEEAPSIMKFHDKMTKQNLKTFSNNLYLFCRLDNTLQMSPFIPVHKSHKVKICCCLCSIL